MNARVPLLLTGAAMATVIAVGGCGGGDDHSGSTAASTRTTGTEAARTETEAQGGTQTSASTGSKGSIALGSPADVPRSQGGDNSLQDYGSEASESDRAAAGRVLASFYGDLAGGDTEAACGLLASGTRQKIEQTLKQFEQGGGSNLPTSCAEVLKLTSNVSSHSPQLRLSELLSLRQLGGQAFLIYRAGDGKVYAIGMQGEGGDWKVGAVGASPLGT